MTTLRDQLDELSKRFTEEAKALIRQDDDVKADGAVKTCHCCHELFAHELTREPWHTVFCAEGGREERRVSKVIVDDESISWISASDDLQLPTTSHYLVRFAAYLAQRNQGFVLHRMGMLENSLGYHITFSAAGNPAVSDCGPIPEVAFKLHNPLNEINEILPTYGESIRILKDCADAWEWLGGRWVDQPHDAYAQAANLKLHNDLAKARAEDSHAAHIKAITELSRVSGAAKCGVDAEEGEEYDCPNKSCQNKAKHVPGGILCGG